MVNMIPREHGAWSMLITAFASALIVAHSWRPVVFAAAGAVLVAFLLREPLIVLARQALVWRQPRPETRRARVWAAVEISLLMAAGIWLALHLPLRSLIPLAAAAGALTLAAVWMMVHNRRRSLWLQVASAAGLSSSALMAALASRGRIEFWAWALWVMLSLHAIAGVLVVRERLDARVRVRTAGGPALAGIPAAALAAVLLSGVSLSLAVNRLDWLAAAALLSAVFHFMELRALGDAASLAAPLRRAGFRALGVSLVYAGLITTGLWRA